MRCGRDSRRAASDVINEPDEPALWAVALLLELALAEAAGSSGGMIGESSDGDGEPEWLREESAGARLIETRERASPRSAALGSVTEREETVGEVELAVTRLATERGLKSGENRSEIRVYKNVIKCVCTSNT